MRFSGLTEFRGANSVSSFQPFFVCKCELTEFFTELTEFAPKLSEAQWVLFSETVLSKQYSARFLKSFGLASFRWSQDKAWSLDKATPWKRAQENFYEVLCLLRSPLLPCFTVLLGKENIKKCFCSLSLV